MASDLLRSVSDTALWVASYRAHESERPDALFHDPWARRLAGERGEALGRSIPLSDQAEWAIIVRTAVFDEVVLQRVAEGADAVLDLAAGLHTRPYRLALPPSLLWIEVDLPVIIDYKEEVLAGERPVCRLERVRLDLADAEARQALFASVAARCRSALVLSEGLMIYLRPDSAAGLAEDLHRPGSFRWWFMDLDSPHLQRFMQRAWGKTLDQGEAHLRFAPAEGPEFFRPHGWRPVRRYSFLEESRRLGRDTPRIRMLRALGKLAPPSWRNGILRLATADLLERIERPSPRSVRP
jgi:methyltransferase (TIGR00027 family)